MARDFDRKALKEDVFQDTLFRVVDWVYQRRRWFIGGISAVLVLVAGGVGYYQWNSSRVQAQFARFYQAERTAVEAEPDDAARLAKARAAFEGFLAEHPRSRLAPVAWMHVARLAWEQQEYAAAREAYTAALNHAAASPVQRDLARIGLAKVAEAQGELEASAEQLRAVSDTAFKDLRALNLGRIALARQQPQEAREHFEQVARGATGSILAEWARQNLDYHP
jgi:predicted negative regulator of RcsB-dependent stress response